MNETRLFIYFNIIRGNCQLVWKYSNRCWNIYLTETKYLLKLYFKFFSISTTHIHIDTSNVYSFPLKMYIVYSGFVFSFGFVNFWNPWRFEERDQICPVLIPWQESCTDIKFLSFSRNIKTQQTLTFLEAVEAEVANPPRLHVDVGQRCLVGGTQTAR